MMEEKGTGDGFFVQSVSNFGTNRGRVRCAAHRAHHASSISILHTVHRRDKHRRVAPALDNIGGTWMLHTARTDAVQKIVPTSQSVAYGSCAAIVAEEHEAYANDEPFLVVSQVSCCVTTPITGETQVCSKNSAANMLEGSALSQLQKRRARARQTQEERIADLARSQRRRLASSRANHVVVGVQNHVTNLPDVKRRLLDECRLKLSSAIDEEVCCVCDCLHQRSRIKLLSPNQYQAILPAMSLRLKAPPNLPSFLMAHYDVSDLVPDLRGLLFSRAGISSDGGQPKLQVCQSCRTSLLSKRRSHPPKFAIANGLYMGILPTQFADTSVTENAMLNLSQPMHYLSVVRGGKHSCLRSHAYYFRADPAPPAMLLPRDVVSSGVIGVTMVGAMTTAQKAAMYKKYDVRVSRLRAQLDWYKGNNRLYRNIQEQPSWETSFVTTQTRVVVDAADDPMLSTTQQMECERDEQSVGMRALDESTWRHNAPQPAHTAVLERDEVCEQSATGLISDFTPVDSTVGVEHALAKRGVVVHRSSGILSDFDPAFWTHAFSDLYPFGRGGLDEPRPVPVSLHEYVRYCLRLSSRQFAQHPSFSLVAFDVLARHHALQAIYIKAKMMPSVVANAGCVPREVLQEYVEHQQDRLRALSQTHGVQNIPVVDERLRDLYASISAGMRAFWGSNEERVDNRKEIFSLQLRFGQPTIFFTISPDCSSSFRVGTLAGAISESALERIESAVGDCLTFTRARLGQIATANPYVCAKYFDIVMSTFINIVLSWDTENGCSRPEPGLFGRTLAFYSSTESQSSTGSLHAHMLIWVEEMPSTVSEYYDMCAIEGFRTAMIAYVDSLVASSVPLDMSSCASCGSQDVASTPLTQAAFKKARRGALRPETLHCDTCCESYGGDEMIKRHAGRVEGIAGGPIATDESVFVDVASSHSLPCDPDSSSTEAARVARALLYYQHHHWFHAKSCFKVTKRTPKGNVCRMFMPKDCSPQTHWTPENTIQLKRVPGNEYVNTYSPVLNAIFKCNHDVKFLAAGEGPEKAYYMMKYATKPQQSLENPWALHLHAYDKAKERVDGDSSDAVESGRRVAQSMCCNLSNPHEVAAPMACLYLVRGSVVYASHKFVKLHIKSVLSAMFQRDEGVDVVLESDHSRQQFTARSVWQDYILRPVQLEQLDLMTFVSTWERKKSTNGLKFLRAHPQHETHTLHRRTEEHVVVVTQKRLPDVRREDVSESERLRFQQSVMVLFRRFRSSSDLINGEESFGEVFQRWWQRSASKSARLFVEHNNDYYASRELANERHDPGTARYRSYEGGTHGNDDVCDGESDSDDDGFEEIDSDCSDEIIQVANQSPKFVSVLEKSDQVAELAARSTISDGGENLAVSMNLEQVEQCLLRIHDSSAREEIPDVSADVHCTYPDLPTRVSLLERATSRLYQHVNTEQSDATMCDPVRLLNDEPAIHEVSSAFRLNSDQHRMFAFAGEKLLTSLLIGHGETSQMLAFLGGLPGAGKSRVIGALQCLAEKWKVPGAVATAAYQGVAAQAANGQTIHKLFGWFVDAKKKWVPNQAQRERFAQLRLLILDEISTCDVKILGMVDRSLRILLDRPSTVFGGVHVLLVGDWLQQLPVAGQPAFQSPRALLETNQRQKKEDKEKAEDDYLLRVRGANAYQAINKVVILTENMRHRNDPLWRGILDKWRWGQYDLSDIDVVNKIAYEENWMSAAVSPNGYCPIIVTSNALRVEFNTVALRAFCKESKAILHRFPAVVTRAHRPISSAQRRSLRNIRDDKTKGMPTMLELALGSTSQCTKNVSPALKLANGTIGTVVGFVAAVEDVVQVQVVNGVPEHTHSLPPEVVFLKLKDFEGHSFSADLPQGVVPVSKRVERGIRIKMENRSFSVTIAQVPLVPAYSLTTEKCQGLTVDKMVLAPLRHQTRWSPQSSSLYVAVTRVKSLRQLYLMSPLTLAYVSHFKPSEETLAETHQLHLKDQE